ncbi:MAG: glucose 1-dehydrogenase [Planctomycetota bacterium]|jgi:NAD(P)-dependent dehydrogenase (short-subunit alcohol dehydrogenase family)|nr:glucose 1-dehydrogenase [Planctomycetota bacterium]
MSLLDKFSLRGKTGIVTGGGQGLGRGYCRAFAEMGADIVVAEINPDTGEAAAAELRGVGVKSLFVKTDACEKRDLEAAAAAAKSLNGRVDFMVNNAGIVQWKEAELVTGADWRRVMSINLDAVFYGCQAVFGIMREQGGGSIVNIASMSAHIVNVPQCQASYNASKAAVRHLSKSLAVEWAKYGIRVNSVSPGYMSGPMAGRFWSDPEIGPIWKSMSPLRRPGEPEELWGALVLLVSDAASFITGSDFVVDGGFTCV